MGWRFRKVFQAGAFRWTLSKRGIGFSWGLPGLRFGVSPTGRRYVAFGIPGTGLYYIKYFGRARSGGGGIPGLPAQIPQAPPPTPASTPVSTSPAKRPWWMRKRIGGGP
jgi:Protein of unknown function (DUF4236)